MHRNYLMLLVPARGIEALSVANSKFYENYTLIAVL